MHNSGFAGTRVLLRALIPCLLAALACGDATGTNAGRIFVHSGDGGSDTVLARHASPLTVEIRDSRGRAIEGAVVIFRGAPMPEFPAPPHTGMFVCSVQRVSCATWSSLEGGYSVSHGAQDVTGADGRASARLQFGTIAGPAYIDVSVPELSYSRRVEFTTLAGNLARFVVSTRDTALYPGAWFDLEVGAADRFENPRSEAVAVESATPNLVGLTGGRVTALATGRGKLVLRSGTLVDTAFVSVPPRGRLVAFGRGDDPAVANRYHLVDTDGGARRAFGAAAAAHVPPQWISGEEIVFQQYGGNLRQQLHLADTLGNLRLLLTSPGDFITSLDPSFAHLIPAIFFRGERETGYGVYRVSSDGAGAEFLFSGHKPAASPDGSQVAYSTGSLFQGTLRVRDMASGATTDIANETAYFRWSPVGDLIAFTVAGDTNLYVISPDGNGQRSLGRSPAVYSWSPDGEWLVTADGRGLYFIRVADGVRLPIAGTRDLHRAAWRP